MKSLKDRIFSRKSDKNKENQIGFEIGLPTNVVRGIHVSKNQLTGDLEGLPKAWTRLLKSTITEDEQNENPSAGKYSFLLLRDDLSMIHSLSLVANM
jgi:P21-Rho-binding domain